MGCHRERPVERQYESRLYFPPVRTSARFAVLGAKSHAASAAEEEE